MNLLPVREPLRCINSRWFSLAHLELKYIYLRGNLLSLPPQTTLVMKSVVGPSSWGFPNPSANKGKTIKVQNSAPPKASSCVSGPHCREHSRVTVVRGTHAQGKREGKGDIR